MKVLSIAHLKGGVGKTTAAVNLAYLAAADGVQTLLVDLDAQGAASYLLRFDYSAGAKVKQVARAKKSLREAIFASDYRGLDVLPASLSYRKLPVLLADGNSGKPDKERIQSVLSKVGKPYELIVVDAPAGLTLESEEIIRASDLVLVPVIPTPLALGSYETFHEFSVSRSSGVRVRGFLSMVDRRRKLHRELSEKATASTQSMWPVEVPYSAGVERMSSDRSPLPLVSRPGRAVEAFDELWGRCAFELGFTDTPESAIRPSES